MPLDAQTEAYVSALNAANDARPAVHELTPADARAGYLALARSFGPMPEVAKVENRTIPGPAGAIPVRIYRPSGKTDLPVIVYFHGGGWVIGDLDTHDRECRILAADTEAIVVAVDYRLSPEHPFPAAHEDCWAATAWVASNASELEADTSRMAIAGDSAGGNLAAYVALEARDHGLALQLQVLIYPATDARGHAADFDGERRASLIDNRDAPFLTLYSMHYFFSHLVGDQDHSSVANDWRLSPLLASDHTGLAPAYVATCEFDPIRDEGDAYAQKLRDAGVTVEHRQWAGQPHMLFQLSPVIDDGAALIRSVVKALKGAFSS